VQKLLERLDNDHAFLNELLIIFRQDSVNGLHDAKNALAGNDLPGLAGSAHTLKGMMRNLLMNGGQRSRDGGTAGQCDRSSLRDDRAGNGVGRIDAGGRGATSRGEGMRIRRYAVAHDAGEESGTRRLRSYRREPRARSWKDWKLAQTTT
jgi:hypothetical protein